MASLQPTGGVLLSARIPLISMFRAGRGLAKQVSALPSLQRCKLTGWFWQTTFLLGTPPEPTSMIEKGALDKAHETESLQARQKKAGCEQPHFPNAEKNPAVCQREDFGELLSPTIARRARSGSQPRQDLGVQPGGRHVEEALTCGLNVPDGCDHGLFKVQIG